MSGLGLILPGSLPRSRIASSPSYLAWASGAWVAANRAIYIKFRVDGPVAVANAKWWIGAAAGNIDVGVGTISGTTWNRIASTGATAASGSNAIQTAALSATVPLAPGVDYAMAMTADTITTLTIGRFTSVTEAFLIAEDLIYFKNSEGTLGTTATVAAGAGGSNFLPFFVLTE